MGVLSEKQCRAICERLGLDPAAYSCELVEGTAVELDSLSADERVAWGDGKTNHIRVRRRAAAEAK